MAEDQPQKYGTHLQNLIVERQVRQRRQEFIDALRPDDILKLVVPYHERGSEATFFRDPVRGSYNMCYFVQMPSSDAARSPDRWVVRVPLDPYLPFGSETKLESEIATMMLVSEKTTIPIPKVIAYAIGEASKIVPNFAIIEYLEGQKLNAVELRNLESAKKARFNASMADFFVQLRRLEFDAIGRVVQRNGDFVVDRPPATIDINSQALEGLQPEKVVERYAKGGPLRSASDYLHMLLDLADNAYTKSRCSVDSDNQKYAREQLYYLSGFRHFAEEWQAKEDDDQGPFVLVHGDLETFNLLIGDEGEIVGFLDWEWSRVLPRRYLTPPTFPSFNLEAQAAYYGFYWLYKDGLRPLFDAVRARELELYGNTVLADEWGVGKEDGGFMVAKSLEAWSLMGFFSENFIDIKVHKGEGLDERVESFLQQDPSRRDLIERKMQDDEAYSAELKRLIESEKSASQVVRERCHRAFSNCKLVLGDNLWNKDGPTRSWPGMAIICGAGLACIISASLRYAKWSRRP